MREGKVKKGGQNPEPTTPRPPKPSGQGPLSLTDIRDVFPASPSVSGPTTPADECQDRCDNESSMTDSEVLDFIATTMVALAELGIEPLPILALPFYRTPEDETRPERIVQGCIDKWGPPKCDVPIEEITLLCFEDSCVTHETGVYAPEPEPEYQTYAGTKCPAVTTDSPCEFCDFENWHLETCPITEAYNKPVCYCSSYDCASVGRRHPNLYGWIQGTEPPLPPLSKDRSPYQQGETPKKIKGEFTPKPSWQCFCFGCTYARTGADYCSDHRDMPPRGGAKADETVVAMLGRVFPEVQEGPIILKAGEEKTIRILDFNNLRFMEPSRFHYSIPTTEPVKFETDPQGFYLSDDAGPILYCVNCGHGQAHHKDDGCGFRRGIRGPHTRPLITCNCERNRDEAMDPDFPDWDCDWEDGDVSVTNGQDEEGDISILTVPADPSAVIVPKLNFELSFADVPWVPLPGYPKSISIAWTPDPNEKPGGKLLRRADGSFTLWFKLDPFCICGHVKSKHTPRGCLSPPLSQPVEQAGPLGWSCPCMAYLERESQPWSPDPDEPLFRTPTPEERHTVTCNEARGDCELCETIREFIRWTPPIEPNASPWDQFCKASDAERREMLIKEMQTYPDSEKKASIGRREQSIGPDGERGPFVSPDRQVLCQCYDINCSSMHDGPRCECGGPYLEHGPSGRCPWGYTRGAKVRYYWPDENTKRAQRANDAPCHTCGRYGRPVAEVMYSDPEGRPTVQCTDCVEVELHCIDCEAPYGGRHRHPDGACPEPIYYRQGPARPRPPELERVIEGVDPRQDTRPWYRRWFSPRPGR